MSFLKIHPDDNVQVNLETGHKEALRDIHENEMIIKYGFPIGHAVKEIKKGELVHTDNVKTNLSDKLEYTYKNTGKELPKIEEQFIDAFVRADGRIGIRNEIWIIPLVGCVNKSAESIARKTGAHYFSHPYGCSQLGDDQAYTQTVLASLVKHPNAGGVLVLGLGCENNNISEFKKVLGKVDESRVRFLNSQDVEDEIEEGVQIVKNLQALAAKDERQKVSASKLLIGLKCGGSDGFSGITANPLIGRFSDCLISMGGSTVLTEVPEMFGAETLLMDRAESEEVFQDIVSLINDFKDYYTAHHQVIYENPSPGNKAGGITTLEEKSLGCVQKGGHAKVVEVLHLGEKMKRKGLHLLNGPGNDMVSVTNLAAAGCHMILFSTGRGTPFGGPVPTVKIATNEDLYIRKSNWMDFNAGEVLKGKDLTEELLQYVLSVANGKETKNEINDFREIAIFKDGVTL